MSIQETRSNTFGSHMYRMSFYLLVNLSTSTTVTRLTPNIPLMLTAVPYSLIHSNSESPTSFGRTMSGRFPVKALQRYYSVADLRDLNTHLRATRMRVAPEDSLWNANEPCELCIAVKRRLGSPQVQDTRRS